MQVQPFVNKKQLRSATCFLHVKLKMSTSKLTSLERMTRKRDFCPFQFKQKILLFKDNVNFVHLIVFSVVEKILFLFDCLTRSGLNSQMQFGLCNRFD